MTVQAALMPTSRKSLADQVADTLVEAIGLGTLGSGERMIEKDIAERLDVSRIPVREAFKILETQGILVGEPHRGLRVLHIDELLIDRICEARLAIESIAVRSLVREPQKLHKLGRELDVRIADMASKIRGNDLVGINRADIAFHEMICLSCGNNIIETLWQAIARHIWIVFGREILTETSIAALVSQHEELKEAIASADPDQAVRELEAHILRQRRKQRVEASMG